MFYASRLCSQRGLVFSSVDIASTGNRGRNQVFALKVSGWLPLQKANIVQYKYGAPFTKTQHNSNHNFIASLLRASTHSGGGLYDGQPLMMCSSVCPGSSHGEASMAASDLKQPTPMSRRFTMVYYCLGRMSNLRLLIGPIRAIHPGV